MDIIERYLQAVRFWLPKRQKHDIIAELSADIHAQIDDRETQFGRKLDEPEIEAILKRRGRPVLVATGYLPQRYLIGPALFPIYMLVLKIILAWSLTAFVISWVGRSVLDSFSHGWQSSYAFGSTLGSVWMSALVSTGVVTVLFAFLERAQARWHFLEGWDPRKLPPLSKFNLIKRSSSSIEMAVNLVVLVWWAANMSSPIELIHPPVRIYLSPLWLFFFWGILCVTLLNTALAAANIVRPYWTGFRATVRLFADSAGAALFCWMLKANVVSGFVMTNVSAGRPLQITDSINGWMARMFPAAVLVVAAIVLADVFRIARLKMPAVRLPWEAATI